MRIPLRSLQVGALALPAILLLIGISAARAMPQIEVDPGTVQATQLPNTTSMRNLEIGNVGSATLDWSIAESSSPPSCDAPADVPWTSVSPSMGSTSPGGTTNVEVTFDSTGLSLGTYEGTLCIDSNDPATPRVEVRLTLEVVAVLPPPQIEVDPGLLQAAQLPDTTSMRNLEIGNVGAAVLDWSIVESPHPPDCDAPADISWASVSPTSGSTPPGDTTGVAVTFDSIGLALGTYEGTLCIESNDPDSPRVEVRLTLMVASESDFGCGR